MMRPQDFTYDRSSITRLVGIGALACVLSACGGGGGGGGGSYSSGSGGTGSGGTGSGGVPPTNLNCNDYPKTVTLTTNNTQQTYSQVCLLLPVEHAAVTPGVSISTTSGNIAAHGTGPTDSYPVYARVIAQAADQDTATNLAKTVVIKLAPDGTISPSPDHADFPQSLNTDFEIFTVPSTNLTFNSTSGNIEADHYNATLNLTPDSGNVSLDTVDGKVGINSASGNISVRLAGTGWTGSGLTATSLSGNISVTRPAGYQAAVTAQTNTGNAAIDDKSVTSPPVPAKIAAGSGMPIALKSDSGNISVATAM